MNRAACLICCSIFIFFNPFAAHSTDFYVSKLGNNSDGLTWETAFTSVQAALDAIPDGSGGHRVLVRPDTYMEAMLSPAASGAKGAYNELIGDVDNRFGSGKTGPVILDSGDPKRGFKSYDWWGNIRSNQEGWSPEHTDPTFSAIIWDRWKLKNLYATGGDGGLFWDLTNRTEPFTVVVEDCVGVGRAFGGGVASCLSRPEEPIAFRRCHLWALDWWGDTAGAYVRVENETMPEATDVVFEDCVMVGPQCALKGGNFGFETSMRIRVEGCKLIALNFSQPQGTPTDGAIQSVQQGKYLHVDLEDSLVMGFKVFGVRVHPETVNDLGYTTKGDVRAYVQFTQEVPKGFHTQTHWPADIFQDLVPPVDIQRGITLENTEVLRKDLCEISPVIWKGRLCHMEAIRPGSGGTKEDYYLLLKDAETGEVLSKFAQGYGLACAHVQGDTFYAFASEWIEGDWNHVTMFASKDLVNWETKKVIEQENEHLFNSSVCEGPDGFAMAYESNDPQYPAFTTKFAVSKDLRNWDKVPSATFGTNRYTACPCIRYVDGYYYVLYLERLSPLHFYEAYLTRSKDLEHWELSGANPILSPQGLGESINTSDPDLIEIDGKTYIYYAVGDQLTWMDVKRGAYPGSLEEFYENFYRQPGIPDWGSASAPTLQQRSRASWFNDAKFGIFIHWGLYALHGKNDKGAYVSWAMQQEGIPVSEYERYADRFDPKDFDPDEWMSLFKEAGARYVTFTSKHHDGFCLFDSDLTDYDTTDRAARRDIAKDLVEAARRADLRLSFYYSMLDWHHPDFANDLGKYVEDYLFGQVGELCEKYHPDGIWFDGEWDHPASTWKAEELVGLIRQKAPAALVNDRLGKGERGVTTLADFYTREQLSEIDRKAEFETGHPAAWEACLTIGESWGFRRDDTNLKSGADLIRALVDVASRGGNFLLNVGPTPEGTIPAPLAERLLEIGNWMAQNGEAIYGTTTAEGITASEGKLTAKGSRLYLHLETNPTGPIHLQGLRGKISRARLLASGQPLEWNPEADLIYLPDLDFTEEPVVVAAIETE